MGHTHDWAVGWTRMWGKSRGLEVVGSDIRCEKKSGGSLKGERGIVTASIHTYCVSYRCTLDPIIEEILAALRHPNHLVYYTG